MSDNYRYNQQANSDVQGYHERAALSNNIDFFGFNINHIAKVKATKMNRLMSSTSEEKPRPTFDHMPNSIGMTPTWQLDYEEMQNIDDNIEDNIYEAELIIKTRVKEQFDKISLANNGNEPPMMFHSDKNLINRIEKTQNLILQKEQILNNLKFKIDNQDHKPTELKILNQIYTKFVLCNKENIKTFKALDNHISSVQEDYTRMGQIQETAENDNEAKKRFNQIEGISKNMLLIEMSMKKVTELVYEQGTIADRIDSNIEEALESTNKGNKELEEIQKNVRTWAFRTQGSL